MQSCDSRLVLGWHRVRVSVCLFRVGVWLTAWPVPHLAPHRPALALMCGTSGAETVPNLAGWCRGRVENAQIAKDHPRAGRIFHAVSGPRATSQSRTASDKRENGALAARVGHGMFSAPHSLLMWRGQGKPKVVILRRF